MNKFHRIEKKRRPRRSAWAVHQDYDRLTQLQEEILAALPQEKKALVNANQDAFMEMMMDESEAAFAEGVRLGIRLMAEADVH